MAKIVSSWNDWDPLKRVIVGRCDNSVIPPEEPATSEKVPVDSEMRGMWGLRPVSYTHLSETLGASIAPTAMG